MYDYKDSKANIINVLNTSTKVKNCEKIPLKDSEFTYENGIISLTSAIFIDIKNSTELFKNHDEKLARLMRAFTSEIIEILQENKNCRQIGIRGDCVYGIYTTPREQDIYNIFIIGIRLNTFMKMFNKIIVNHGYKSITVGIGLGCDEELIIKAGRSGTGINEKIWIGKAIIDASNLSSITNRNGFRSIGISQTFYEKIKNFADVEKSFSKSSSQDFYNKKQFFYQGDRVLKKMNQWIDSGMKE